MVKLPLKCPHCGSESGVFQRLEILQYYTAMGEPDGQSDSTTDEGRTLYCNKCCKAVCRKSTLDRLRK